MSGESLIFGIIGFFLGGITGGYLAGRYLGKDYKGRVDDLTNENNELRAEIREKSEKRIAERERELGKTEKKLDKSLKPIKPSKPTTAEVEKLSEAYRSEAFDAHFAERVAPDDSDDTGDDDAEDDRQASADELAGTLSKQERRELRRNGFLHTADGRTMMTKPFAEAFLRAEARKVINGKPSVYKDAFDEIFGDDPFVQNTTASSVSDKEQEEPLKISMIDEETFKRDLQVRDCQTYTYYQEDGVLVDEMTNEIEEDQAGILGEEAMGMIDETERDTLWIDNEPDDTLYEIIVDHNMGYYRDVLGR